MARGLSSWSSLLTADLWKQEKNHHFAYVRETKEGMVAASRVKNNLLEGGARSASGSDSVIHYLKQEGLENPRGPSAGKLLFC